MKHILIVTHGFPPGNNMAAHRNYIRAKGFEEQGYRVSIVTRAWGHNQNAHDPSDVSPDEIIVEELFAHTKVYRVPFGPAHLDSLNFAQRLALRLAKTRVKGLWKKFVDTICFFVCPADYAFRLSVNPGELGKLLDSPPDYVLASGDPWSNFEVGRELARHFGAKQIAEYRDPWNYTDDSFRIEGFNNYGDNLLTRLRRNHSRRRERRFNGCADLIIAASEPFLRNALAMTGRREGMVVTNGFDRREIDAIEAERYSRFTLCYIGTIYSEQRAEIFFEALERFVDRRGIDPAEVCVKMIGSRYSHGFKKTLERIKRCRYYERIVEFTHRLSKEESLKVQKSSAVNLFFAHNKTVGVIPGKFMEYIAVGTPILLVPSDHGELEGIIRRTGTGTVCDTVEQTVEFLDQAYSSWKKEGTVSTHPDRAALEAYSYQEITRNLIHRLEQL